MERDRLQRYIETQKGRPVVGGSMQELQSAEQNDIASIAENYGVNIITAIRTYGNLGPFRPLELEDFKGIRMFDILLRPNQIASCSTVAQGDTQQNLYSRWGVILGKGKIHEAFPYDAVTSVKEGEVVSKFSPRMKDVPMSERVAYTIFSRQLYNEVNASIGGVSGMFYCLDEGEHDYKDFPSDKVLQLLEPLNLPQYLLRNGEFYSVPNLADIKRNKIGEKKSPLDIVQMTIKPTEEQQDNMTQHLTETLTLAPRNPITSGVTRGQFAYAYRSLQVTTYDDFYTEQAGLIADDNPSLQLYSGMASYSFGESANGDNDVTTRDRFYNLGSRAFDYDKYEQYKARILDTGNLTVTKEDFLTYLKTEKLPDYLQDH